MFPMSHWAYTNHEEPHQDNPVLHNSNWGGIRTGGVLTAFKGLRATSGRRLLNNKCSTCPSGSIGTTRNQPSGHSCPPKLQLRRRKDRWSLERIRGGYSQFWEKSPKQLMVPMTLQVYWNGWEDPSGHSCPPQLQLSRHKDRCHLCLEGGLMFW